MSWLTAPSTLGTAQETTSTEVKAFDFSKITAVGHSHVWLYDDSTCVASDFATIYVYNKNKVEVIGTNVTVHLY